MFDITCSIILNNRRFRKYTTMATVAPPSASAGGEQAAMMSAPRQGDGEGVKPVNPAWFPLSYKASVRQWWTNVTPKAAEYHVMSFIPYLRKPPQHLDTTSAPGTTRNSLSNDTGEAPGSETVRTDSITDPYGPRAWHSSMVQLSGQDRALNEFSVTRLDEKVEENLVMLHGYGAGLGFFYKNFEGISRVKGWKVYALDMLGMGRSSRPNFRIQAKDQQGKIAEAENWFIDALEEWRIARKLDKFTLLGHSMGGYMAVAYALKYPGHLNKLILASPVGIPEDPYAMQAAMPEPGDSTMANEFTESTVAHPSKTTADTAQSEAAPRRPIPKWLSYAWDANISPFSLIRWAGPLGPRFVSGWSSRRFSHLGQAEADALHDYSVSLFKQKGSGEYALAYILAPGAFARSPLIRRMAGLGRQPLPSPAPPLAPEPSGCHSKKSPTATSPNVGPAPSSTRAKESGFPVVFMYGSHDWMDKKGGKAAVEIIEQTTAQARREANATDRELDNGRARLYIIDDAGHHLYLDGWKQFDEIMRREMEETTRDTKRLEALQHKQDT